MMPQVIWRNVLIKNKEQRHAAYRFEPDPSVYPENILLSSNMFSLCTINRTNARLISSLEINKVCNFAYGRVDFIYLKRTETLKLVKILTFLF